ncbi:MAG: putative DNA-binding domain-containing protein [Alphaproteobacteria bacterium]
MSPELQARMAAAIRLGAPQAREDILAAASSSRARVDAALQVHASTTRETLTGALRDAFPSVARALSKRRFAALAEAYIRRAPPRQASLWFWGDDFADHLDTNGASRETVSLARLDHAWHGAFAAEDIPLLAAETLRALSADALARLKPRLHPAARLPRVTSDAFAAWRALASLPTAGGDAQGSAILLTRPEAQVQALALSDGECLFLRALDDGSELLAAFERAAADDPRFDLQTTLARLLAAGAFRAFHPDEVKTDA